MALTRDFKELIRDQAQTDPAFRKAIARYLEGERQAVGQDIEVMTAYGPFRRVQSEHQGGNDG